MERSRADRILADWDSISRQARRPGLPPRRAVTTALPASMLTGAALLVVVVVAAGLWLGLPPGVGQPGAQASASPVEPSVSPVDTWRPLAVIPPQGGADTLRAEGTLRITDTCVYLEWPPGELTLLYWPSDRTTWSGESRAITFANFDRSVVTVGDGDHVVLGGSGGSGDDGMSGEEFVRRMDWVAPPASSCSLDRWWVVGAVGD